MHSESENAACSLHGTLAPVWKWAREDFLGGEKRYDELDTLVAFRPKGNSHWLGALFAQVLI